VLDNLSTVLTYIFFVVGAIIMALQQGFRDFPSIRTRAPGWILHPRWNYAPAVLLLLGALSWALQPTPPTQQTQPSIKSRDAAGGQSAADVIPTPRVTGLQLEFGVGHQLPVAITQNNIWRWYALNHEVLNISPDGAMSPGPKTWTLYLSFDEPVACKQVLVRSRGGFLPRYEVKDLSARTAVIAFLDDLQDLIVDVSVLS
jgi:hypothetical protein